MTQEHVAQAERDISFTYAQKKAEKIAAAIYLITNLLSDREPLKWTLRNRVVVLIGGLFTTAKNLRRVSLTVKALAEEILSLLEVAAVSHLISEMNASILKGALADLLRVVEEAESPRDITEKLLEVPKPFLRDMKDMGEHDFSKRTFLSDRIKKTTHAKPPRDSSEQNEATARRKKILDFVRSVQSGTISDIARAAPEVSEKTIQRDLGVLMGNGLLERRGNRRWVTYHVKQS